MPQARTVHFASPNPTLEDVRQILVFRPNAVGGFVFALPCLSSLKAAYPAAALIYVGQPWHAKFLVRHRTPVDEVLVLPPCSGINADAHHAPTLDKFVEGIRQRHIDLALQIYGGGRIANPLVMRFAARTTLGLHAPDAPALDGNISYSSLQNRRLQLLEVAALAGARPVLPMPELKVLPEDRQEVAERLQAMDAPFVLLHPGASDPRRRWPAFRFAAIGDELAAMGFRVLVHGVASEAGLCRAVTEAMRYPAVDVAGRLSLGALCGLLERASLLVSNDTGPLHLATAIGTPVVGIYWLGNLVEAMPLQQHRHRAVWATDARCPVCKRPNLEERCEHDVSFVGSVEVERVLAMAEELLTISASEAALPADPGQRAERRPTERSHGQ